MGKVGSNKHAQTLHVYVKVLSALCFSRGSVCGGTGRGNPDKRNQAIGFFGFIGLW